MVRRLNSDGTYSGLSQKTFDTFLNKLKFEKNSWNPVLESKKGIGREFKTNYNVLNRYFRSDAAIDNKLITCIQQDGKYHSMTLKELDDMILKLVQMAG